LPRIERELARRAAAGKHYDPPARGYAKWKAMTNDGGIVGLFACIEHAHDDAVRAGENIGFHEAYRQGLMHVSRAERWYWACVVFEAVFLPGMVWFLLWPWVRGKPLWQKFLHLGLFPVLLYLPFWMSYCNPLSTSYPRGGVIYPMVCIYGFGFDTCQWEIDFLMKVPPMFEPITQGRATTFADFHGALWIIPKKMGPVNVGLMSAVMIGILASWRGGRWWLRRWRVKRAMRMQGFLVEMGRKK
jgi:hypothetical protein